MPSIGASGGILTAWNGNNFEGETLFKNEYSISIRFTSRQTKDRWILTNIYGPCTDNERHDFIEWFQNIYMPEDTKWMIMGDFNYIRYPTDGNVPGGSTADMMNSMKQ